jgi:hypothetical protein
VPGEPDFELREYPPPKGVPPWLWGAVRHLHGEVGRIDAEAGQAGQVEQDLEAEWYEWRRAVALVLLGHVPGNARRR